LFQKIAVRSLAPVPGKLCRQAPDRNNIPAGEGFSPISYHFFSLRLGVKLFLPRKKNPAPPLLSLRDQYGINTDFIRIDPVLIP
jgi:hypothetical protein